MVNLWYLTTWNDWGTFNCLFYTETWPHTHLPKEKGKMQQEKKVSKQNANKTQHFPVAHKERTPPGRSFSPPFLGRREAILLKPPSAQCPELPVGKVTRKNSTIKPTENQDTELSCDSQHSWLFNSTTKCHHLVKATGALSPTDTRNKKNLGFNN